MIAVLRKYQVSGLLLLSSFRRSGHANFGQSEEGGREERDALKEKATLQFRRSVFLAAIFHWAKKWEREGERKFFVWQAKKLCLFPLPSSCRLDRLLREEPDYFIFFLGK